MVRLLLLLSVSAFAQTAITELTSFWEMDVTDADRIAWDSKGSAHGTYFGTNFNAASTIFSSGWYRGTGTQAPFDSGGVSVPGSLVDTGSSSFAYCIWVRRSSTAADSYLGRWSTDTATRSWNLTFNATPGRPTLTYGMTNGSASSVTPASPDIDTGDLAMVCMHYNSSSGQVGVSANGNNWTLATPAAPFQVVPAGNACSHPSGIYDPHYPCTLDFGHVHNQFHNTGAPVIGRTMFWNGYVPSNAELSAIYNSGSGRDATYFGLSFTAPTRPLTVTLANASFADDANLADDGLYWLRPYPLHSWNPSLAGTLGDYVWLRSTDHHATTQKIFMGFSASPTALPASWTEITPDLTRNTTTYPGLETPMLVWNPDTDLFHMYAHGDNTTTSAPFEQETLVWTSPDLDTWTLSGVALAPNTAACPAAPCYNHTGYAYIARNGTGDWVAQSLLESSEPSGTDGFIKLGLWTSTDGLSWSFDRETLTMEPKMPYRGNQNHRMGIHVSYADSDIVISHNYVGTPVTELEFNNPPWLLFEHPGDNSPSGDFLQDVRAFVENGTVYLYAKWSYQQPSTVRLYTGTLSAAPGIQLSDRRPIGAMFIADSSARTATNPRGYNVGGDPDFLGAGFATAKSALLAKVDLMLDNADLYSPRPQAVMIWDLEGQEFQHVFTYVGAPQALDIVAPEMDDMADDIMALIRSRGYEPGLTLRPHRFSSGSGRPTNACLSQGATDAQAYIDTAASYPNRGYICGPGDVTFGGGSTVTVSGEFAVNYQSGSVVRFVSTGTLPSPLVSLANYYMCSWDNMAQTFTVDDDSGCGSPISSYTGGSGTHTMMSWRGPMNLWGQELPADLSDAYTHLSSKIDYARSRWGIKYFYVDSTAYCSNAACQTNTVLPNEGFWDLLNTAYPDITFMPENSASGPYTMKYLSFNNGHYGPASTNLVTPHIQDTSPGYTDWRTEIQGFIADGIPYIVTLNTEPTGGNANDLYQADLLSNAATLATVTMTDSGPDKTRVFKGTPGTAYRFPVTMRVYFASSSGALAASTTYCTKKSTVSCYLNGVLQGSATLDLSSLTYYQTRYYDYDGNVISNPKTHGVLQ